MDGLKDVFAELQGYTPPADVDSCLSYCYYDSEAGLSFHFLCFANFDNESIDMNSYEVQLTPRSVNLFRYEPIYEVKKYTKDSSAFTERIQIVNAGYHNNEKVLPIRELTEIDHLRCESHPDDIKVLLRKDELETEEPFVRLTEIKESKLYGQLLNEPFKNFGIHRGDTVHVVLDTCENQVCAVVDTSNLSKNIPLFLKTKLVNLWAKVFRHSDTSSRSISSQVLHEAKLSDTRLTIADSTGTSKNWLPMGVGIVMSNWNDQKIARTFISDE